MIGKLSRRLEIASSVQETTLKLLYVRKWKATNYLLTLTVRERDLIKDATTCDPDFAKWRL